jgi:hypothetical protein
MDTGLLFSDKQYTTRFWFSKNKGLFARTRLPLIFDPLHKWVNHAGLPYFRTFPA